MNYQEDVEGKNGCHHKFDTFDEAHAQAKWNCPGGRTRCGSEMSWGIHWPFSSKHLP